MNKSLLPVFTVMFCAAVASSANAQTPPGAPQNLTYQPSGSTVIFNWQAPTTGTVPTHYVLEARLIPQGPVAATIRIPAPATSYPVPNVPNGTYHVTLRAENASGSSPTSNMIAVTTSACAQKPNPPQNLHWNVSGNVVTVTWTAPAPQGPCTVTQYLVSVGTSRGTSNIGAVPTPLTVISGPLAPGTYWLRVEAHNGYHWSDAVDTVFTVGPGPGVSGNWQGTMTAEMWSDRGTQYPVTFAFVENADGSITASYIVQNKTAIPYVGRRYGSTVLLDRTDGVNCETWTMTISNDTIVGDDRYSCGPLTGFRFSSIVLQRQ